MWMPTLWQSPCHSSRTLISSPPYTVLPVSDNDTRFMNFRSLQVGWAGHWTRIRSFIQACQCSTTSSRESRIATNWYGLARAFAGSWFGLRTTLSFLVGYMSCLQMVGARVMLTSTFFVTPAHLVWDSGTPLAMLGSHTPSIPPHLHLVSSIMKPSLLYPRSTGRFITSPFALVHGWLLTPTTPILLICSTACVASLYITPSSSQLSSYCSSLILRFASSTSQAKTTS